MEKRMKVGLFIPCYVNAVYPQVGRASYELLRKVGCEVEYPLDQTCCGQPMANAGFEKDAKALAERMNALFEKYDYVVGPSASCVVFVREGHPAACITMNRSSIEQFHAINPQCAVGAARKIVPQHACRTRYYDVRGFA